MYTFIITYESKLIDAEYNLAVTHDLSGCDSDCLDGIPDLEYAWCLALEDAFRNKKPGFYVSSIECFS